MSWENGDGSLQPFTLVNVLNSTKIAVADLDGDGRPDFVCIGGEA